jgi:hypothetical protein
LTPEIALDSNDLLRGFFERVDVEPEAAATTVQTDRNAIFCSLPTQMWLALVELCPDEGDRIT